MSTTTTTTTAAATTRDEVHCGRCYYGISSADHSAFSVEHPGAEVPARPTEAEIAADHAARRAAVVHAVDAPCGRMAGYDTAITDEEESADVTCTICAARLDVAEAARAMFDAQRAASYWAAEETIAREGFEAARAAAYAAGLTEREIDELW